MKVRRENIAGAKPHDKMVGIVLPNHNSTLITSNRRCGMKDVFFIVSITDLDNTRISPV